MVGPLLDWCLNCTCGNVKNPNAFVFAELFQFKRASTTKAKYQPADFWPFHIQQRKPQMDVTWSHLANGPWNKSLNFIFHTKYVIQKSSSLAIGQVGCNSKLFVHLPGSLLFFPNCQQIMKLRCSEFAFNIPSEDLKNSSRQFWRFHDPPPHDASNFLLAPHLKSSCLPYM